MNEDEELLEEIKKRPKFVAQHMTRELVVNGRLPHLESYGDHLARYGKGFSQMLNMAGEQNKTTHQPFAPKLMHGVSLGHLSIEDVTLTKDIDITQAEKTQNRLATIQ